MPARCSKHSARLVFPAAAGPTKAKVRMAAMLGEAGLGMGVLLNPGAPGGFSGQGMPQRMLRAAGAQAETRLSRAAGRAAMPLLESHLCETAEFAAVQLIE